MQLGDGEYIARHYAKGDLPGNVSPQDKEQYQPCGKCDVQK